MLSAPHWQVNAVIQLTRGDVGHACDSIQEDNKTDYLAS